MFFKPFIYSQDFIKSDTLKVKNEIYKTSHISIGNSSLTKYFKVVACDSSDFKKIEIEIVNCYTKHKLEYTEFYIISIPNYTKIQSNKEIYILMNFINKIDTERMNLNLSTALVKHKYDFKNNKFEYYLDQPKKELIDFKDYKLNVKPNEVCLFLRS
ncbi:hypothetical protein J3S90_15425 [Flavobacterium sp. P4023]|uniref:Uncharacterized protein n=1 Tax=Flavobacterium flabelliforme TaxID=2816119 RepID=A0ABS5CX80_9FLAO|nr:hypothetical protein [Flavobacterium flabelliforme]MBP4143195.1 hypothetical protein [Flavobacterium flabelliforme]